MKLLPYVLASAGVLVFTAYALAYTQAWPTLLLGLAALLLLFLITPRPSR